MNSYLFTRIYEIIALALILSLSFSKSLPNILLIILVLIFFLEYRRKFLEIINYKPLLFLGILFVYIVFKQLINSNFFLIDHKILSRFLILLMLPIILISCSNIKIAIAFIVSAFSGSIIALYNTAIFYTKHESLPFNNGETVNKVLVIDRPYLGFFCLVACLMCIYAAKELNKFKYVFFITILYFIAFILLIAARLTFISIILIFYIYILFYYKTLFFKKLLLFVLPIFIVLTMFNFSENFYNRFSTNLTKDRIKLYDPRIIIWDSAYKVTKENNFNFVFGLNSYGDISDMLVNQYKHSSNDDLQRRKWFVESRFNTHNQFIDFYLIGGLIGLFLFSLFFYSMFQLASKLFILIVMIISLLIFCLFENVFHRQLGIYMIALIISFIINEYYNKNPLNLNSSEKNPILKV